MTTAVRAAEVLRQVPLFASLSDGELRLITERTRFVHHEPGQVVLSGGHEGIGLHVIVDGHARVSVGSTERRTLKPGDYFGEITMIDGRPRSATVTAETPLDSLVVLALDFRALMTEYPTIMRALLLALCQRLRALEADLLD